MEWFKALLASLTELLGPWSMMIVVVLVWWAGVMLVRAVLEPRAAIADALTKWVERQEIFDRELLDRLDRIASNLEEWAQRPPR